MITYVSFVLIYELLLSSFLFREAGVTEAVGALQPPGLLALLSLASLGLMSSFVESRQPFVSTVEPTMFFKDICH